MSAVSSASQSASSALPLPWACVAAACVREGCRVLFPWNAAFLTTPIVVIGTAGETPGRRDIGMSEFSTAFLRGVANALSCCLADWARSGCNVHGNFHYLPSVMVFGRSMLHLFQWVLFSAGYRVEPPEPVHLPAGLSGVYPAHQGSAMGLRATLGGLQLAQQIGADRGELLPGCLPATVAFAQLLAAQGCGWHQCGGAPTGVDAVVAVRPPVMSSAAASSGSLLQLDVRCVRLGSSAARWVALQHLTDILQSVTVGGAGLLGLDAPGVALSDIANSHNLWKALHFRRHLITSLKDCELRDAPPG